MRNRSVYQKLLTRFAKDNADVVSRQREAQYRLMADNIGDIVTGHGANGDLVFASPAVERSLGLSVELENSKVDPNAEAGQLPDAAE